MRVMVGGASLRLELALPWLHVLGEGGRAIFDFFAGGPFQVEDSGVLNPSISRPGVKIHGNFITWVEDLLRPEHNVRCLEATQWHGRAQQWWG